MKRKADVIMELVNFGQWLAKEVNELEDERDRIWAELGWKAEDDAEANFVDGAVWQARKTLDTWQRFYKRIMEVL